MWPIFTDKARAHLLVIISLLLAGCTSAPEFLEGSGAWNDPEEMPASSRVQREYQAALQYMETGDGATAMLQFEDFVASNPRWPGGYVNLAILYDADERTDEAVELLNHAVSIDPEFVPALNHLGVIKRRQGDFKGAEQAWLRATRISPQYEYAWYNLGVLYELYMQDLRAALDHFRRYQELAVQAGGDPKVAGWITDLERRVGAPGQAAAVRETL
jgi:tetratricopeptide (TPR) repeat protein